jgi:hypothetical protein
MRVRLVWAGGRGGSLPGREQQQQHGGGGSVSSRPAWGAVVGGGGWVVTGDCTEGRGALGEQAWGAGLGAGLPAWRRPLPGPPSPGLSRRQGAPAAARPRFQPPAPRRGTPATAAPPPAAACGSFGPVVGACGSGLRSGSCSRLPPPPRMGQATTAAQAATAALFPPSSPRSTTAHL